MLQAIRQGFRNRDPRIKVVLPVRLRSGASWSDGCIHNVSTRGMLVASKDAPSPGTYIELRRGPNVVVGRVVWRNDRFFGVKAQDRIDLDLLRRNASVPGEAANGPSPSERRSSSRRNDDVARARSIERSRAIGRAGQFATFGLLCLGASLCAGHAVHKMLAQPTSRIAAVLPQ